MGALVTLALRYCYIKVISGWWLTIRIFIESRRKTRDERFFNHQLVRSTLISLSSLVYSEPSERTLV